ncbi:uncharacterized protein LOC111884018 isoform X1 [Lactuca sativa]|uniref:uncharacterized protein LOC111884018 isoform X1 n=1 Tax=Lactuca sativa TaxID=4236 RepID=UPI001C691B20|nr:uncharacterized protein LOC111884018 isoform X1 [Lactuca sativa]
MPFSQAPSSGANLLDMLSELSVPASINNPQMSLFGTNPHPPPPPPPPAGGAPPSVFVPGGGVVNLYDDDGPVVGFSGWLNYWGCEARLAGR